MQRIRISRKEIANLSWKKEVGKAIDLHIQDVPEIYRKTLTGGRRYQNNYLEYIKNKPRSANKSFQGYKVFKFLKRKRF